MKNEYKLVKKALSTAGIKYEQDPVTSVVIVEEEVGSIESYSFEVESDTLMSCVGLWGARPSKKMLPRVIDLINRINNRTAWGRFSVHPEEGGITAMVYILHPTQALNEKMVIEGWNHLKALNALFENAIHSVISGDNTPAKATRKAMEEFQKARLSTMSLSELADFDWD